MGGVAPSAVADDVGRALAAAVGPGARVLARRANPHASSSASEILRCELGALGEVAVLAKHARDPGRTAFGHRGGLA